MSIRINQTIPIIRLSLDQINRCLKEYVHGERNYLSTRNNDQLIKFKDNIDEKDPYKTIVSYQLAMNLVSGYIAAGNVSENDYELTRPE